MTVKFFPTNAIFDMTNYASSQPIYLLIYHKHNKFLSFPIRNSNRGTVNTKPVLVIKGNGFLNY